MSAELGGDSEGEVVLVAQEVVGLVDERAVDVVPVGVRVIRAPSEPAHADQLGLPLDGGGMHHGHGAMMSAQRLPGIRGHHGIGTDPPLDTITSVVAVAPMVSVVSRREADVLELVCRHLTNAEIAARLYISERTVEVPVSSLLRKLGVKDRRQLARQRPPAAPVADARVLPPAIGLLADTATFVGRDDERGQLRRRWELACAATPSSPS